MFVDELMATMYICMCSRKRSNAIVKQKETYRGGTKAVIDYEKNTILPIIDNYFSTFFRNFS
jgi:hypothetical protein